MRSIFGAITVVEQINELSAWERHEYGVKVCVSLFAQVKEAELVGIV